jgi:hypothetical protein
MGPIATQSSQPLPAVEIRLSLRNPDAGGSPDLDGAWWPRSGVLPRELPPLIRELHRRGALATRVSYSPQMFQLAARKLEVDGRLVRLGWFNSMDPHLLTVTHGTGRLNLLVVPPETSVKAATRAMRKASAPGNKGGASLVLAASTVDA